MAAPEAEAEHSGSGGAESVGGDDSYESLVALLRLRAAQDGGGSVLSNLTESAFSVVHDAFALEDDGAALALAFDLVQPALAIARSRLAAVRQTCGGSGSEGSDGDDAHTPDQESLPVAAWAAEVLEASAVICLLNAENYTAWNVRREALLALDRDRSDGDGDATVAAELGLSRCVLARRPKAIEPWNHRRWVMRTLVAKGQTPLEMTDVEFEVCTQAAERHPRNYYAWKHRTMILDWLAGRGALPLERLLDEQAWVMSWIRRHVADHSAVAYGLRVLRQMLESGATEAETLVAADLEVASQCLLRLPGHETLWLWRRGLIQLSRAAEGGTPLVEQERAFVQTARDALESTGIQGRDRQLALIDRHLAWVDRSAGPR